MKTKSSLLAFIACLLFSCYASAQDYIVQTELDPSYDPPLSTQIDVTGLDGEVPAAFAISPYGSRFDLYSVIETTSGKKIYHLATKIVGPYPTVEINVSTLDTSTSYEHRTRADQRFGIDVTVAGIQTDAAAPESMKKVWVKHILKEYPDGEYSFAAAEDTSTWRSAKTDASAIYIESDQTYPLKTPDPDDGIDTAKTALVSRYIGDDFNEFATGEERVQVFVKTIDGTWHNVQEKTVRVFPKHYAEIVGSSDSFDTTSFELSPVGSQREYNYIPQIAAECEDIYPSSITTLSLYKGTYENQGELVGGIATSLKDGDVLRKTAPFVLDTTEPQTFTLVLPEDTTLSDGPYTVILEIQTPFNENTFVVYSDFLLKRSLNVRGSIHTQE